VGSSLPRLASRCISGHQFTHLPIYSFTKLPIYQISARTTPSPQQRTKLS